MLFFSESNTFGGFWGASSCVLILYLQYCLLSSPTRTKQKAEGCIVKKGQTGNNCQPVEETEVPTHYQNHLQHKRQVGKTTLALT